ncbi:MAG: hypothetical protein K8R48_00250 [Alphaproteobacteria bacterium]|nr:hypothetical protein [Alphaproteobacteria bacterium]
MKKFFLTALLTLQSLFATQGNAQQQIAAVSPHKGKIAQDISAGKVSLVFETVSYHIGGGYNNINPGIGFEYRLRDRFHVGAGIYRNSMEVPSVYALAGIETSGKKRIGFGAEAGIITGYNESIIPAAMPYLRLGSRNGRLNAKIDMLPPVPDLTPLVFTCQLRLRLR